MDVILQTITQYSAIYYLIAIMVIGFVYLIIKYYGRDDSQHWRDRNVTPGKMPSMLWLWKKRLPEDVHRELIQKYGKLYGVRMFGKTTIICNRPDIISQVLSKEFTSFINRRKLTTGDAIADNMLQITTDDKWKRLRAIVSPTFSTGKLRKMRPLIDDCLQTLVTNIGKMSTNSDHSVDMKTVYGAYTMEVIIQVAFGTKVDALIDDKNPIILNAKKLMSQDFKIWQLIHVLIIFMFPKVAKFFGMTFMPKDITGFFTDLINKIIAERRTGKALDGGKRYDFLQLLLDANERNSEETHKQETTTESDVLSEEQTTPLQLNTKSMSDAEMISQCVLFFIAGYETTATTISYAIYLLSENPESQQKLFEESKSIFETKQDIDYDAIERLEYLNACLNETLRLFAPALALEREASEDITLTGDGGPDDYIKVFKGDMVQILVSQLHKDPEQFNDPEKFEPDRFLPQNISHHPYSYLPFGAGPRNCVAKRLALMEAKLAILYSVYNYRFEICDKTSRPPKRYNNLGLIVPKEVVLRAVKRVH